MMTPRPQKEGLILFEKSKRGFLNVIFGRVGIIFLLLLLQFFWLFSVMNWLGQYMPQIRGGEFMLTLLMVVYLVNREDDPTIKMTWIILVMALPVFGTLLYVYIKNEWGHKIAHFKLDMALRTTKHLLPKSKALMERLKKTDPQFYTIVQYAQNWSNDRVYENTAVHYYAQGCEKFEDLLLLLEEAEDFIFMEYFIIDEGIMWKQILDILERKVLQGVEVRVLYDGTCALYKLPYDYPETLKKLGIQCKMFAPLRPFASTHYNNRDHRKILVIDGKIAITGGINMADEYINAKNLFGHWKDTAVKLEGEAVNSFTLMFLQMWNLSVTKRQDYQKYLTAQSVPTPGYVLPYGDSPLDDEHVGEMVYYHILNTAKHYVHITTPYLILDNEMLTALTFASKRGVNVSIILPHIPDKKIPFALAHGHYAQLLKAGVHIYEYLPGFVNAKLFVSDDQTAVVGTINLDYRSLYHHFECASLFYQHPVVEEVEKDFQKTKALCHKITLNDVKKDHWTMKATAVVMKVFSPLM